MATEVKSEIKPDLDQALTADIESSIQRALSEDLGDGDATTNSIVSPDARLEGLIKAKQQGVVAGLKVAAAVFNALDQKIEFQASVQDGAFVDNGVVVAAISGPARSILTAERTALNFLGRMSGIATLTRQFVERVAGTAAKILDTRKTAPGLRAIDKLAVRCGGGENHRFGLYDMILIKDNHIDHAGSLRRAVELARVARGELEIEVEARTLEHVKDAIDLGVKRILLDNMSLEMMTEAVRLNRGRARLEASGNVSLATVRQIAETGVDFISVGELTHSARVFDFSLIVKTT
ncbi:MAG TPA: carboxylating nicotinate-nucleotide diphosphorylase [Pyrinomonadaceae bacterium]|nr:carboxylating nicotinate-nucleotide diphosphorylase [Pyrinomonadaceae bacterium]